MSGLVKFTEFDASDYLEDDEFIAEYLTAALEDEDPAVFLAAVGNVAKARGLTAIAESAGPGRKSLDVAEQSPVQPTKPAGGHAREIALESWGLGRHQFQ